MKYYPVICFWCKKEFNQRQDTVKRQLGKYGHTCCKHCFGNEKSFKDARTSVMTTCNPFKGKKHSIETKALLTAARMGKPSWNKGLTSTVDERVRKYGENAAILLSKKDLTGSNNNNWKGGISHFKQKFPNSDAFKKWMGFRLEILKEDAFRCYKCSNAFRSNQLDIHHLLSQTAHPGLIYDKSNCVVFCRGCHRQFHKEFGKKSFTPVNAMEFINRDRSPENNFKFC